MQWANNTNGKLCEYTDAGKLCYKQCPTHVSYTTPVQHIFRQFQHSLHVQYTDKRDSEYSGITAAWKVGMTINRHQNAFEKRATITEYF